jgi:hypothetical protein
MRQAISWAPVGLALIAIALMATPSPAAGQARPAPAAELAAGALLFADDGLVTEGFAGGAVRFYVLPRISVGPEVAFIRGENHSHLMFTGNVTFDVLRPVNGEPRPVTPFAVAGGGLFRTREPFPNNEVFTSIDGAFTAGGGMRALVGKCVIVGAEVRVGWELHIRLNGMVGVRLGRSRTTTRAERR